jgi:hypothetical protein
MGFGVGFLLAMRLLEGQSEFRRLLVALVAGFVVAFAFFALVGFAIWIAGAVLGLVAGILVLGIINIFWSRPGDVVSLIIAIAGVALGIVGGRLLGDNVLLLAMAAAGSFMILRGTQVLFESRFQAGTTDPATGLYQRLALFLFAVFFAVSALAQVNERRLQRALRR